MKRLGSVLLVSFFTLLAPTGGSTAPTLLGSTAMTWEQIQAGKAAQHKPVFRSPTATLDELEMHVTQLPPGKASHPPHRHAYEELLIIREGTVEALVDGQPRRLGPGAVIFQASNMLHNIKNVGQTPASYHVISWKTPATAVKAAEAKAAEAKPADKPAETKTAAKPAEAKP
jgi:XRE family transcriptional regulator, regulator of sulfur utilization